MEEGALIPSVRAATCKTVYKVAKMCSHFCKKRQDNFHLMAILHSPFEQRYFVFSSKKSAFFSLVFSGVQKEQCTSHMSFLVTQWYLPQLKFQSAFSFCTKKK